MKIYENVCKYMYINAYRSIQIHTNLEKSTQIYLNPIQILLGTCFFTKKKSPAAAGETWNYPGDMMGI